MKLLEIKTKLTSHSKYAMGFIEPIEHNQINLCSIVTGTYETEMVRDTKIMHLVIKKFPFIQQLVFFF